MSGRSAHVRRRGTETKSADKLGKSRGRPQSNASSDNATITEYAMRPIPGPPHGWDSGLVIPEADITDPHFMTGPTLWTEETSAIEKSGLRTALDKKSSDVRNGLAKAFAFKKQDKGRRDAEEEADIDFRPQPSTTVRQSRAAGVRPRDLSRYRGDIPPVRYRGTPQNGPHWGEAGGIPLSPPSDGLPLMAGRGSATPIKRWAGAGRRVQRWNQLGNDPELWDPNGDVLIFFGQRGQSPQPNPSFRMSSHTIEATGSHYLITLLRDGFTEQHVHTPYEQMNLARSFSADGPPTPPHSDDNSVSEPDGQISYEMYFPAPPNMTKLDQLRHHITTRNVFALLHHASLVGLSLHQALSDLHARLESYMPPDTDSAGTIINYLLSLGIDDVRNDPETAVGILSWSEDTAVRWEEGWREGFLHCAGMHAHLESCADFEHLSPITRALLERAHLEMQLRVQAAEERLAAFQYGDMWPAAVSVTANASGPVVAAPAKAAADRLEKFLVGYYKREFGSWPPPVSRDYARHGGEEGEDVWLTRTVAQLLQSDFSALYDYLVDRDIVWDESEARSSRKWMMVPENENRDFEADTPDLPMTDMLIEFDNKHRFPHIPHPYPLVPESIPPLLRASSSSKSGGRFGGKPSKKSPNTGSTAAERRIQLAYTEATNISALSSESTTHSGLIDAFAKFEKADHIGETDPSTARRGRWVLVYGILQTLASVSVDAPHVRYCDGVAYHLSPRLRGVRVPPWTGGGGGWDEAAHELSHCWTVSATAWEEGISAPDDGAASSPAEYHGYHFPLPLSKQSSRSRIRSVSSAGGGAHTTATAVGSSAASVLSSSYSGSDRASTGRGLRDVPVAVGKRWSNRHIELPVEEREWVVAGQKFERAGLASLSESGVYTPAVSPGDGGGDWRGLEHHAGVFLGLDHGDDDVADELGVDVDEQSFDGMYSGYERNWDEGAGRCGGAANRDGVGTGPDSVGPVIRDFDELGVLDW